MRDLDHDRETGFLDSVSFRAPHALSDVLVRMGGFLMLPVEFGYTMRTPDKPPPSSFCLCLSTHHDNTASDTRTAVGIEFLPLFAVFSLDLARAIDGQTATADFRRL